VSTQKKYTKEFKLEAIKLVISDGYPVEEAAKNLGIAKSTMWKWVNAFKRSNQDINKIFPGKGQLAPDDAKVKLLEKALAKVTRERDILKKALGYFAENHD
jgi:transposase